MSLLTKAEGRPSTTTFVIASSTSLHWELADYRCDGVADQVEIQAAIDIAAVLGGQVRLLAGDYHVSAVINLRTNVSLVGEHRKATRIIPDVDTIVIAAANISNSGMRDMGIYDRGALTTGWAMALDSISFSTFENILIMNPYDGLQLVSTLTDANTTRTNSFVSVVLLDVRHDGFQIQKECHDNKFLNLDIIGSVGSRYGMAFDGTVGGRPGMLIIGGNEFINVFVGDMGGIGVYFRDWIEVWFNNMIVDGCGSHGIEIRKVTDLGFMEAMNFSNVWSSSNGGNGVKMVGLAGAYLAGVKFVNLHVWDNAHDGLLFDHYVEQCRAQCIAYHNGYDGINMVECIDCNVSDSILSLNGRHGIQLQGGSDNNVIAGNICISNNELNGAFDNIRIEGSSYNLLSGNKCRKGNHADYGINIPDDASNRNCLVGNDLYDSGVTGDLNDAPVTNPTLKKNNRDNAGTGWLAEV